MNYEFKGCKHFTTDTLTEKSFCRIRTQAKLHKQSPERLPVGMSRAQRPPLAEQGGPEAPGNSLRICGPLPCGHACIHCGCKFHWNQGDKEIIGHSQILSRMLERMNAKPCLRSSRAPKKY
jgi:hypothetical protein